MFQVFRAFEYSRVHISLNEVFSKILKIPSIVQKKMIPHMKAFGLSNKMKQKKSKIKKNQNDRLKKRSFSSSANSQYFFVDWSSG